MTFSTMCALRVYLKRGDDHREGGFVRRLFKQPLATYLLQQALKHRVTHASVQMAHSDFSRGAKAVSVDFTDIPFSTLPVCLELVAPKPILEQFVRDHAKLMSGATLVMLEGVHIAPAMEATLGTAPAHVQYIKADDMLIPVDHVDVGSTDTARTNGNIQAPR